MSHLELVALVVRDYDAAIRFFVDVLQFELVEDTPSLTNDGRPKRWVVIRPDGGQTGTRNPHGGLGIEKHYLFERHRRCDLTV
jgi:catechol 2,3-dioxygenase-like lactoylglutathione lyase family enzyme